MVALSNAEVHLPGFRLVVGDLNIQPGFYWLQGPNGSGKTTFLRTVLGAQELNQGTVTVSGEHRIGYVPQNFRETLIPWMSSWRNLCLLKGSRLHMIRVLKHMKFHTSDLRKRPASLSGGQCQRVALVREVESKCNLLLLDEPFSAMDVESTQCAWELLFRRGQESGIVVLLSLHHVAAAEHLAAQLVKLRFERTADDQARVVAER